ncbi:MAG TPA: hypothetical protein VHD62_04325 [Opitutaceae bacterium]|nr:hypothetical protein [Opitutaceae bacterium]
MQEALVCALRTRRPQIHARWEALLRIERINTPLAHPDTLVHLIDATLDEILQRLNQHQVHRSTRAPSYATIRAACHCGRNPLLTYFLAGEQALLEATVLAQSEAPPTDATERSLAISDLYSVMRRLAQREIEAFCSVCQYRECPAPVPAQDSVHSAPAS